MELLIYAWQTLFKLTFEESVTKAEKKSSLFTSSPQLYELVDFVLLLSTGLKSEWPQGEESFSTFNDNAPPWELWNI